MKERKFEIKVESNKELSEFDLVCYLDGVEIKREIEYSVGDCLNDLYNFERNIYDEYKIDCRVDKLKIKIDIEL